MSEIHAWFIMDKGWLKLLSTCSSWSNRGEGKFRYLHSHCNILPGFTLSRMIYEYEIVDVQGLFVVYAMGRPQISFPTLEGARSLLREIAGLPFQAISYWPDAESEPNTLTVSDRADTPALPISQLQPIEVSIELDYQALRVETSRATLSQRTNIYSAAIIRGINTSPQAR